MNCTVYLFGEFGLGYTQYPQDGAEDIFRHIASHAEAQTQIAIHRDGNLMYYAYVRRLDEGEGHYMGYAFSVEGLLLRDVRPLFDLFGSTFENMVIADRLLTLNSRGHVVANVGLLIEKRPEVERVTGNLCASILRLSTQFIPLQKLIFDHLSTQVWTFGEDADPSDIRKASQLSGYTIVQKGRMQLSTDAVIAPADRSRKTSTERADTSSREADTPTPLSDAAPNLTDSAQNSADADPNSPDTASKKIGNEQMPAAHPAQSRWDGMKTFLLCLLLCALGGLGYTTMRLLSANQTEMDAKTSNNRLKMQNAELSSRMADLQTQLEQSELRAGEMEKELVRQDSIITALRNYYKCNLPLLATSLYLTCPGRQEYSNLVVGTHVRASNDLVLQPHVRYFGLEKTSVRLTLRWYSPRRIGFFDFGDFTLGSKSHDDVQMFDIEPGEHEIEFNARSGDSNHRWEPGKYAVELWAGNECVQRKEFWID